MFWTVCLSSALSHASRCKNLTDDLNRTVSSSDTRCSSLRRCLLAGAKYVQTHARRTDFERITCIRAIQKGRHFLLQRLIESAWRSHHTQKSKSSTEGTEGEVPPSKVPLPRNLHDGCRDDDDRQVSVQGQTSICC